jgi:hypothetical protein
LENIFGMLENKFMYTENIGDKSNTRIPSRSKRFAHYGNAKCKSLSEEQKIEDNERKISSTTENKKGNITRSLIVRNILTENALERD